MSLPSKNQIGDVVGFKPMARHCEEFCIEESLLLGKIVAIRFTEAKVFYDIVDDYLGYMFNNVDSAFIVNAKEG